MPTSDNEQPGVSFLARNSSNISAGVPIKKRPIVLVRSPSPPPPPPPPPPSQLPSLPVGGCDVTGKNHGDLDQDSSPSNSVFMAAPDIALTIKVYPGESGGGSLVEGSIGKSCTEGRDLPVLNSQVESEVASISGPGTSNMKESTLDNKCTLRTVLGSTQLIPALKEALKEQTYSMPISEGKLVPSNTSAFRRVSSMEFQSAIKWPSELSIDGPNGEASLLRRDKQDHFLSFLPSVEVQCNHGDTSQDAEPQVVSTHLSVDRANWDLNTMMDSWENCSCESVVEFETVEQVGLKQDGITKDNNCLDSVQMRLRESNDTDYNNGRCMPQERDQFLMLPNSSTCNSGAFLNLQLKPSLVPDERLNLGASCGEATSIRGIPIPSLSAKPTMSHISDSRLATCRSVKLEPHENFSKKGARKVEMSSFKQVGFEHVKSEPVEGSFHEAPKTTCSSNFGSTCSKIVKSEPLANLSRELLREVEGKSSELGQHFRILTSCDTEVSQDMSTCVKKALGLISESIRANIVQDASESVGDSLSLVSKAPIPNSDKSGNGEWLPVSGGMSQVKIGTVTELSDMVSEPLLSDNKDLVIVKGACEVAGLSAHLLEPVVSDDGNKPLSMDNSVEVASRMGCLDGEVDNVSTVLSGDKLNVDSYGHDEVAESSDMDISEDDMPGSSHGPFGDINSIKQVCCNCEDGEIRNFLCQDKFGRSCEERHSMEATEFSTVGMTVSQPLNPDEKGSRIEDGNNLNRDPSTSAPDSGFFNNKNGPGISPTVKSRGSSDGVMSISSDKRECLDTSHKIPRDRLKKNEGQEKESRSNRSPGVKTSIEGRKGEGSGQPEKPRSNHSVSAKSESLQNDTVMEHAKDTDRGNHSKKAENSSASGKLKSVTSRLIASRIVRERLADKSHKRETLQSQESRDDICDDRSRRFNNGRYQHQVAGKGGSDLQNVRRRGEFQYISRMPLRRQSPGDRGQVPINAPMVRHPMRNTSPGRFLARNMADFIPPSYEEKLMRTLPDEMMDPRMFSRPVSPYERAEAVLIRRGRRSLSPVQRRCPPLHMSRVCVESSPRSQRLPPQWSSPRRSPDGFDGHPEVVRCRSPPMGRLDRMRSPHCLPDEVLVRRHGSPPYIDRLPDRMDISPSREHMMDIGPLREHEFSRPVRALERNIRRFDLIDPREIAEKSFEPLFRNQAREISGEQCIDNRSFGGRHGLVRSVRQRLGPPDNGSENFHFHGDGPPRPSRFCPEPVEEFSERVRSRDSSGRIRNRLGNMICRPRDIEQQEDNYMRYDEEGWREVATNDLRPKRRRF